MIQVSCKTTKREDLLMVCKNTDNDGPHVRGKQRQVEHRRPAYLHTVQIITQIYCQINSCREKCHL